MSEQKPHNAPFISQAVKEKGYCGEVSESGEWVCVKDADHDGPHGDERWGAPELNQHSEPPVMGDLTWARYMDLLDENQRLVEQLEAAQAALHEIAENGGWRTVWLVDEGEPERGQQPTTYNAAQEIARAALASSPASRSD